MAEESGLPKLTVEYLNDHMIGIHTFDSFGRSLVDHILSQAVDQLGKGPANNNEVKIQVEFRVSPNSRGCTNVYTTSGRIHVEPTPVRD